MAEVALAIGGRSYTIACRDGGEDHLRGLATQVDAKVEEARAAVGTPSEVRQLLFAALLLADEANEAGSAPGTAAVGDRSTLAALESVAGRLESLADALEQDTPSA
jgi:cell division protein ZapA